MQRDNLNACFVQHLARWRPVVVLGIDSGVESLRQPPRFAPLKRESRQAGGQRRRQPVDALSAFLIEAGRKRRGRPVAALSTLLLSKHLQLVAEPSPGRSSIRPAAPSRAGRPSPHTEWAATKPGGV
eukprot:5439669-Prymnesium_polylepis.1